MKRHPPSETPVLLYIVMYIVSLNLVEKENTYVGFVIIIEEPYNLLILIYIPFYIDSWTIREMLTFLFEIEKKN